MADDLITLLTDDVVVTVLELSLRTLFEQFASPLNLFDRTISRVPPHCDLHNPGKSIKWTPSLIP